MRPFGSGSNQQRKMPTILHIEPPPGCTVRVISDLHLAHKRSCAPTPHRLMESMGGVNMLVLAGDTAETREACAEREHSIQLRAELRELCRQRGVELVELAGNHDPDIEAQLALLWGGGVAIMHGHSLLHRVSPWSREYDACSGEVKRLIAECPQAAYNLEERLKLTHELSKLLGRHVPAAKVPPAPRNLLREAYHCFWPPKRPLSIVAAWLTCGLRAQAFCERYMPGVELLIIGHFHRSGQWKGAGRRILNTGAWFEHATPYAVDMRDGQLLSYRQCGF